MRLGPVADQREVPTEPLVHDVVRVADEHGPVPQPWEAGDVVDHLGVVVRRDERLAVAAVGEGQVADEVGHPGVGEPLELGVLVEEVVDVPGLVAHDQVVLLAGDDVVEHHEVRDEDLVHPAQRLEAVQVVLVGLALDVRRLVGEPAAGGVHPLAGLVQQTGDRVLGEPVDLHVRVELTQRAGDGDVTPGMAQADRRAQVEHPLAAPVPTAPRPPPRAGGGGDARDELADQHVHPDGIARQRDVAAALEEHELATGPGDDLLAAVDRDDVVVVAVDGQHRAGDPGAPRLDRLLARPRRLALGHEHLCARLAAPLDAVLDPLGRVRLAEALTHEEPEEVVVVLQPVLPVVLQPVLPGIGAALRHPRRTQVRRRGAQHPRLASADRDRRADHDRAQDSRGVLGRQLERPVGGPRQADHDRLLGVGGIEDGQRVRHLGGLPVRVGGEGPVGSPVARPVVGDHPVVARQVGELHLPEPLVDDRPRGQQEDGGPAVAVHLVVDLHPEVLDEPVSVRMSCPHRRLRHSFVRSIDRTVAR